MIDVINYMNSIYNWNMSQIQSIPTRFATNSNYRINYKEKSYFLKLYSSKNAFLTEKWFLAALFQTGCVSEIIKDYDGDENRRASIILPYYSTFTALDAEVIHDSDAIAFNIGKELRKVHIGTKPAEHFGKIHKSEQFRSWTEYLKSRLFQIKMLCEKHDIALIKKVYRKIENSFSEITDNILPSFVHSDLNPDNILYDPISKKLIFIDFERSFFGHYEMDFPKLFWRGFKFDDNLINSFYNGYGVQPNIQRANLYQSIFFIDLLSYLINLSTPSEEDIATINEILGILESGIYA